MGCKLGEIPKKPIEWEWKCAEQLWEKIRKKQRKPTPHVSYNVDYKKRLFHVEHYRQRKTKIVPRGTLTWVCELFHNDCDTFHKPFLLVNFFTIVSFENDFCICEFFHYLSIFHIHFHSHFHTYFHFLNISQTTILIISQSYNFTSCNFSQTPLNFSQTLLCNISQTYILTLFILSQVYIFSLCNISRTFNFSLFNFSQTWWIISQTRLRIISHNYILQKIKISQCKYFIVHYFTISHFYNGVEFHKLGELFHDL